MKRCRVDAAVLMVALVVWGASALVGNGWAQGEAATPLARSGQAEYRQYCASCHGETGKGDGPTAAALTRKPADLTVLAKNNNGVFPDQRVIAIIQGIGTIVAHGSRRFPVWGMNLSVRNLKTPQGSTAQVDFRVRTLVAYLKSVQEK